ncbi:MAG: Adhesin BmaC autotransporter [Luteibacter sp.]|uniref:autotransporter outer membrane beta-barrel domain-containing protein n=1 Tax=Luteibacter sp. TaxID=1886636 RepID=UPI00138104CE|nr:autotransporter outer membrane beta-barrel domain-containing protein [Luteibacter sp.]KAF1003677.1 MAG: Adhesin BmaC autotransporter [Luteibacter sp.]
MLLSQSPRDAHGAITTSLLVGLIAFGVLYAPQGHATCVSSGTATTCDTAAPNPHASLIGNGRNTASGASLVLVPNAQVAVGNSNAVSLGDNATIDVGTGASIRNNASSGAGLWTAGNNTVEFGSNGTINIASGAEVRAIGTQANAEAINVMGAGNRIENHGLISAEKAAAIWFEDRTVGASNVVDNYGTIRSNASANANVIGNSGRGNVTFINRSGARVEGSLSFAGGNDNLTLEANSVITGSFDGGGGTNTLTLAGASGSSDSLAGNIRNFQSLTKTGQGTWTLFGSIGNNAGGSPLAVDVKEGTLALTGNNTNFNGSVNVDAAGILEARAQSLPQAIANGGLVRFAQPDDGTYAGAIGGVGAVEKTQGGVLTLTGINGYRGGTTIKAGTIAIGADSAIGANGSAVTLDGGSLGFNRSFGLGDTRAISVTANNGAIDTSPGVSTTLSQGVTGVGRLGKTGDGMLVLTGSNTYTGGTSVTGGVLQLGAGGTTGSVQGAIANDAQVWFNRADTVMLGNVISGSGAVRQAGNGTTVLTGSNSYAGSTTVDRGALFVNGDQTAATGDTTVASGATLGGRGVIGGSVTVADGATLSPGDNNITPGTLTIGRNLQLNQGSSLDYSFGQANVAGGPFNDLTRVGGDLVLDGTLNVKVSPGGSFDTGIYRVIGYKGALTDNGLDIGTIPSPDFFVQTSVDKQVNLVNTDGLTLNYWDGAAGPRNDGHVNGSDGIWQNYNGNDSWTNATGGINAPFSDRSFAVFSAAPGTVRVDNGLGQVNVAGMQFASDGYRVNGDAITLVGSKANPGQSTIRVGDGSEDGRGYTATIDSVLTGQSMLRKSDLGTLVLGADNTYTGGTTIDGGTLQVSRDANLGVASGGVGFDQGTLRTTADIHTDRTLTLRDGGGTLATTAGSTFTVDGAIVGNGALTKSDDGTAVLTAANTYTGGTVIGGGTLQLGNGGTRGGIVGDIANNAILAVNRSDTYVIDGNVSGTGALRQIGGGTTVLNGSNTYTGLTSVENGALVVGDAAHPLASVAGNGGVRIASNTTLGGYGSVSGAVTNLGQVAVADAMPALAGQAKGGFVVNGTLTNAGAVNLAGTGTGNTLTTTSYVGQNGSIHLNTVLAGDNAPTDRVVIDRGQASGRSTLNVTNVGGLGQATPGNGILLVDAQRGATTATDAFVLGGRAVAGPYEYALYRGGRDGSTPDAWYLRSQYNGPDTTPDPQPDPDTHGKPDPTPDPRPDYRREISDYTALSSMMVNYGRATLGTLHERMGEQAGLMGDQPNGVWARVIGQNGKWNARRGGLFNQGPSFDDNFVALQAGGDLVNERFADGSRNRAGLYATIGHSNGSVTHTDGSRAGTNRFNAYTFGGYWTHYGANNGYIDAVMQGTWYTARSGSGQMADLKTDAFGFAASVEAGYPFQLRDRWILEPQAQLVYQGISVDASSDAAAEVRFGNVNSLAGRAGARLARTWALDEGMHPRLLTAWLRGNVWREFSANPRTLVSSQEGFVPFHSNLRGTWYEVTAGVSAQVSRKTSIYANLGYQKAFGSGIQAVNGTVGVRVNW